MSRLVPQYDLSNVSDPEQFKRFCAIVLGQVISVMNGSLDFTNLKTQQVDVEFETANGNLAIQHNLGKTGVNFIVVSKSATCDIYRGTGDTNNFINLISTVGGVSVTLILY